MRSPARAVNAWAGEGSPSRLSAELRTGRSGDLARRRTVAGLGLVSMGAMAVISLYQMGIIDHLPEPSLTLLDADEVDASAEAYAKLRMPDAVLGMNSYAVTLALAAMGGADRARERPWIPLALAAKAAVDALQAARLSRAQWTEHRAFCSYCLVAAGATFATLPLVLPEARKALRAIRA